MGSTVVRTLRPLAVLDQDTTAWPGPLDPWVSQSNYVELLLNNVKLSKLKMFWLVK